MHVTYHYAQHLHGNINYDILQKVRSPTWNGMGALNFVFSEQDFYFSLIQSHPSIGK